MRRLIWFLIPLMSWGQCDIEILGFDPISTDLLITVNGGQCGTEADSIGEFILGLGFSPPLENTPWPCFGDDEFMLLLYPLDFPGFEIGQGPDNILQTGDTLLFNIMSDTPLAGSGTLECWRVALEEGSFFDECVVLTIMQINDSETLFGDPGLGGFPYPDENIDNNWLEFSLDGACAPPPPPVPVDPEPADGDTTSVPDPTRPERPVSNACQDPCIHVPNVFTPNGDNLNETWRPTTLSKCWEDWDCRVYNRWGETIWLSSDPSETWNGDFLGSPVSNGVYIWSLKGRTFESKKVIEMSGHVTVLR